MIKTLKSNLSYNLNQSRLILCDNCLPAVRIEKYFANLV